jgi:uncharacterized protein (DUF362 family)
MSRKWRLSITACVAIPITVLLLLAGYGGRPPKNAASQNSNTIAGDTLKTQELNSSGSEVTEATGETIVGIGRGNDYAAVVAQAIANAGGLESIVSEGDTVIIKPNLSSSSEVGSPGTTDYRVVAEVVREVQALGAGRIIVAEGAGAGEPFSKDGLKRNKYNAIAGVELLDLNTIPKEDCYYESSPKKLTSQPIYMPKIYVDADVVISVPKVKTNYSVGATLGLKNGFGAPPKPLMNDGSIYKWGLHNLGIENSIVEINLIRKPDFVVIDGIVAGEGNGPLNNEPVDAQIVFAGSDVMAVDTIASYFMGFTPQKLPHLKLAAENGLGESRMENIKVVGADLNEIRMDFDSPFPKN